MTTLRIVMYDVPNCRACKIMATYLRDAGIEYEQVDATTLPDEQRKKLRLETFPTIIFYRNDIEMTRLTGVRPIEEVEDCIFIAKYHPHSLVAEPRWVRKGVDRIGRNNSRTSR